MFEKIKEKRERQMREAQEKLEQEIKSERERLMALSEKELMVETIIELKKITYGCKVISSQCDDIARKIVVWSN